MDTYKFDKVRGKELYKLDLEGVKTLGICKESLLNEKNRPNFTLGRNITDMVAEQQEEPRPALCHVLLE